MSERRAPRVLVLGTVLGQPMGGVRRHNAELLPRAAELLARRGGSLAVLEGLDPIPSPLRESLRIVSSDALARPLLARWASETSAVRRALALPPDEPFDLVHTGHLPAPRIPRTPLSITVHDLRHLEPGHSSAARRRAAGFFLASAVRRAARTIAVSESVRAAIVDRFRVDPERVRVVPNAADHFEPLPRSLSLGAPILCVGHLERRKNVEVVLRALAIDEGLPPLALAGAGKGQEEERLRSLSRELGIDSRVRFEGPFEEGELPRLYAGAACAVLPSRIEGFGIPAIEAQRARVPLAIARTPALVEVAGRETPSFDPGDPAECARAIREALSMPEESIQRAFERSSLFTWDASARALVEAWTEAAA